MNYLCQKSLMHYLLRSGNCIFCNNISQRESFSSLIERKCIVKTFLCSHIKTNNTLCFKGIFFNVTYCFDNQTTYLDTMTVYHIYFSLFMNIIKHYPLSKSGKSEKQACVLSDGSIN